MYLTRNQAGVNSASGVRIPPSPPDTQKPPQGGFCVSGGEGGSDSTLRFDSEARSAGERPAKGRAIPPGRMPCKTSSPRGGFCVSGGEGDLDSTLRFDSEARSAGERPAKGRAIPPAGCHA